MDHNITFTEKAIATLLDIQKELNGIRGTYGETSEEYAKAAGSFAHAMLSFITLKPHQISADGELSLFGANDYLSFGLNAHRFSTDNSKKLEGMFGKNYAEPKQWSVNS